MTIPPDVLARAREAFWKHCPTSMARRAGMGFDDALAVLSRHWPASDAPSVDLTEDQWTRFREYLDRKGWRCPEGSDNMRDIRAAFRAALATPAPAPAVRVVRVAVAESLRGLPFVEVTDGPDDDDEAFDALANHRNAPVRLCIAEIPVPVRDVPTVRASVEAAQRLSRDEGAERDMLSLAREQRDPSGVAMHAYAAKVLELHKAAIRSLAAKETPDGE